VVLENTASDKIPVTSGVPQDTVLGPILFLIYINDLPEYFKHSNIRLFADDSIIYRKIQSRKDCLDLQDDLEAAAKWEKDWLMAFHPDKCNPLSITTKRKPEHFYYNLHSHILESVDSAKYLGITLQSNLKWNKHIDQTASKANKTLSFVRRNLKVDSSSIRKNMHIKL
jgi:type II secretory pathway component PulJ